MIQLESYPRRDHTTDSERRMAAYEMVLAKIEIVLSPTEVAIWKKVTAWMERHLDPLKEGFPLEKAFIYYQHYQTLPDDEWLAVLGEEVLGAHVVLFKVFQAQDRIYQSYHGDGASQPARYHPDLPPL